MSLQYNDTSTFKGIVQIYEKEIGAERGAVSGNTNRLKEFTADANLALDDYWRLAIPAAGTHQLDDSNHTDYSIIYTNLVSGQSDYSYTADANNNLILDIHKIGILPSATAIQYIEIYPTDVQSRPNDSDLFSESDATGVPYVYDKTGNGIFLSPTPDYNATNGLKIYINREASYFVYTDTTKKPGVPGIHHEYFAIKPALKVARRKSLANIPALERAVRDMEADIVKYFSKRQKDVRKVMSPRITPFI